MSPDFPLLYGTQKIGQIATISASTGVPVTTSTSANTKGASWTQIVASTPFEADGLLITLINEGIADGLVNIAIGAGGSEQVLLANLYCTGRGTTAGGCGDTYFFPIQIPVATRISAKSQSGVAAGTDIDVTIHLLGSSFRDPAPLQRVTSIGPNTADSGGVGLDPGGSANTKGASWTQVIAATANPIKQLIIVIGDVSNNAMTSCFWTLDIAIGGSGSEQILIADLEFAADTTTDVIAPRVFGPLPVSIPAGTRISAKCQCSIIDATDRLIDLILYGID